MNIPIEIIAAIGAVLLGAILTSTRGNRRRIERMEKRLIILTTMLREHGLKIPPSSDTDFTIKDL
jgi:Mn2+/Fe2+ NRAMP family transporter